MGFWDRWRIKRPFWHICYECLREKRNQAEEAIFYYDGRPEEVGGRPSVRCPRCTSVNTRSFQFLQDNREDAALFGLERIVKKNPRSRFPVKTQP